jgi:hypothetical protein
MRMTFNTKELLTEQGYLLAEEVSGILNVSTETLSNWRFKGKNIPFYKCDGFTVYKKDDVESFKKGKIEVAGPFTKTGKVNDN